MRSTMKHSILIKVFGSIAVLGCAASVAGLGTFASFTSSTSASQSISSGTVSIALGAAILSVVDYRVSIDIMAVVTALCGGYLAVVGAPDDRIEMGGL